MDIKVLTNEIIEIIKEYVYGNRQAFVRILNIVNTLPKYPYNELNVVKLCKINGKEVEIEDEVYCYKCGEKSVFPFTRLVCYDCEKLGYIYST